MAFFSIFNTDEAKPKLFSCLTFVVYGITTIINSWYNILLADNYTVIHIIMTLPVCACAYIMAPEC